MSSTISAQNAEYMKHLGEKARKAATILAKTPAQVKNNTLNTLADLLLKNAEKIYLANEKDLIAGKEKGLSEAFLDRLTISEKVLNQMCIGLKQIAGLNDPIGEILEMKPQPSGIQVGRMRVPLGVIGIIYESRPNVTIDAAALCLKSGNAVILRGGSDARCSNQVLGECIQEALRLNYLPEESVQVITNPDRELVGALITARKYVDVIVPRGGKSLISRLMEEATVPMIKHLDGICHTYVDMSADLELAWKVCDNAKTQRFSPCNAMETLLVNKNIAAIFLPKMASIYLEKGVELRCDPESREILTDAGFDDIKTASEEDWSTEYNAPILSIKIVSSVDKAIEHINQYGSKHTDSIITNNLVSSQKFLREVDSSSIMLNTSTRFADGFEYGLGAEIGISNDKLHARGPVGLEGLTSLKYIVIGHGELRK
ncbi:glutamate-5-semialdehyde dehydrogenase [Burkholderiales bacterium YL45]|uniref:Gamma-glutamyl phosphate reductase n=2 Tax=Turicimonas muris TaxID=1796652 RepID=A0A227KAI6_9BURK|nr:glutamate-5-semialdehyde dehydrogenase [Turicimonas muris]ANU65827.1 glutamate-5-semialdehyde dehydrogenase [Burkholderiales bacterium YL45]OXE44366.1 glutamate-5-semialdehyde dehydrogenase [Turicimonas muris]QQQ96986.1 glutamate-5-semialdehyde dehydrogenase [Turicimonas muris]